MTDKNTYQPISCEQHDNYEIAIMHKQDIRVAWQDEKQSYIDTLTPTDLITRDSAEFLIAQNQDGIKLEIRLDHIKQCEPR